MKLKTNLFQGKKPTLEEGQMIYQIENDEVLAHRVERNNNCRYCIQITKITLYVLLVLSTFLVGWFAFVYITEDLFPRRSAEPRMCGTPFLPDYEEWIQRQSQDGLNTTTYDETALEAVAEW